MAYIPPNPNGQASSSNSAPVVIASDQSALPAQGNVASGATDSGNPVKVGGKYNVTPLTLSDGQRGDMQVDSSGSLKATLSTKLDPINDGITTYPYANYISTITTATTTTVVSFPCVVQEIRVLGGTLGNVSVYDSTTGSGTNPIPAFTPDKGQVLIGSATNFAVGCTIVTAAATTLTVTWRAQ